ncbi:cell division protein FtsA [Fibrivirga algicola]
MMTHHQMDDKIVVGLDIGSTKVCAVAGRLSRSSNNQPMLEVLGVSRANSEGVTKGKVMNITRTVDAINRAIEEVSNQSNVDIGLVNVSFSNHNINSQKQPGSITRLSPGDEVTPADIDHLLRDMYRTPLLAGKEIVHVLPMDFTVDSESGVEDPVGRNGVKLGADFQIITTQSDAAVNVRRCIERTASHLQRDQVLLSPLASAMAVLTPEEREAGVALVDIGGGTTDLAIYHRNVLRHVAVFPWAGNCLTNDIQDGCKVLPQQAEVLKTKFGNANPSTYRLNEVVSVPGLPGRQPKDVLLRNVSIIIAERLKEIAALVQAEIIRSGYKDKLLGGIVLTGGSALIDGIDEIFRTVADMDVRVGYPEQLEYNLRADLVSDPAYATAVGLVWAGFRNVDDRISFISDPGQPANTQTSQVRSADQTRPTQKSNAGQAAQRTTPEQPVEKPVTGVFDWLKSLFNPKLGDVNDSYRD